MFYYNINKESYWVKDLSKGFGVFVKLDYALVLKENILINIGLIGPLAAMLTSPGVVAP